MFKGIDAASGQQGARLNKDGDALAADGFLWRCLGTGTWLFLIGRSEMDGGLKVAGMLKWLVGTGKSVRRSIAAHYRDVQMARRVANVGSPATLKALWIGVLSAVGLLAANVNATPLAIHFSGNQWRDPLIVRGAANFLNINVGSAVEGSFIFDTEGLADYYPTDPEQLLKEGAVKRFSFQTIDHSAPFGSFPPFCGCSGFSLQVAGRSISIAAGEMHTEVASDFRTVG